MQRRFWPVVLAALVTVLAIGGGCRCSRTPPPTSAPAATPSVRLYLVSTLAGAIEPCGCVKDMLGGVDHFAALVRNEAEAAPRRLVLGAGPLLFSDPELDEKRATQDEWKARALFDVLVKTGLAGWAPGVNDFARGTPWLKELTAPKNALVVSNLEGLGAQPGRVIDVGGERVGVTGVSVFPEGLSKPASELRPSDPVASLERAATWLTEQGARVRVALIAMPRGDALRALERVKGFHVALLGKSHEKGEANDPPTAPVLVGETLVIETPNHLQAVVAVDLFVRDGRYTFADGTGIEDEERRQGLMARIADLEARLGRGEGARADLDARRRDLERARAELAELSKPRPTPGSSFFHYRYLEIREKLGSEPAAAARLDEYYRRVNDHNREAFKDVLPPPVPPGKSGYVGVAQCTSCHQEERAFWDGMRHAKAYVTLEKQHKQFNLECVGCHVTGYEEPGGSTVAHTDGLEAVQCETCHGPGSRHVEKPEDETLITRTPERTLCASKCHHPPHVKPDWSVDKAWPLVLGKGHGG